MVEKYSLASLNMNVSPKETIIILAMNLKVRTDVKEIGDIPDLATKVLQGEHLSETQRNFSINLKS